MARRPIRTVEECLWSAFTYGEAQESRYMWTIAECLQRIQPHSDDIWKHTQARKKHECARGCKIKAGQVYFRLHSPGAGWGNELKVCAGCLAMILYFQGAYNLPPQIYTHWDFELARPIHKQES